MLWWYKSGERFTVWVLKASDGFYAAAGEKRKEGEKTQDINEENTPHPKTRASNVFRFLGNSYTPFCLSWLTRKEEGRASKLASQTCLPCLPSRPSVIWKSALANQHCQTGEKRRRREAFLLVCCFSKHTYFLPAPLEWCLEWGKGLPSTFCHKAAWEEWRKERRLVGGGCGRFSQFFSLIQINILLPFLPPSSFL